MNFKFGGRSFGTRKRLVNHHARIGQAESLAFRSRREENRSHTGALANTVGGDIARDELHRVIDP